MSLGLGSWAPRADPEGFERRLAKLEQLVRQQDATIKILQARVDTMGGAASWADSAGAGARDRSRTPPPAAAGFFFSGAAPAQGVDQYAAANGLDDKCREHLRSQPPNVQEYVISQGPVLDCRNPSASVMGRIAKATGGAATMGGGCGSGSIVPPVEGLDEFAETNALDEKCRESLRSQPPSVQEYVISMGPVDGRNPSAMVMGRIARATGGGGAGPASTMGGCGSGSASMIAAQVEEFIAVNTLDEKCAEALRNQTVDCQMAVVSVGAAEGRNASAMIMGRIAKYQRGQL